MNRIEICQELPADLEAEMLGIYSDNQQTTNPVALVEEENWKTERQEQQKEFQKKSACLQRTLNWQYN